MYLYPTQDILFLISPPHAAPQIYSTISFYTFLLGLIYTGYFLIRLANDSIKLITLYQLFYDAELYCMKYFRTEDFLISIVLLRIRKRLVAFILFAGMQDLSIFINTTNERYFLFRKPYYTVFVTESNSLVIFEFLCTGNLTKSSSCKILEVAQKRIGVNKSYLLSTRL